MVASGGFPYDKKQIPFELYFGLGLFCKRRARRARTPSPQPYGGARPDQPCIRPHHCSAAGQRVGYGWPCGEGKRSARSGKARDQGSDRSGQPPPLERIPNPSERKGSADSLRSVSCISLSSTSSLRRTGEPYRFLSKVCVPRPILVVSTRGNNRGKGGTTGFSTDYWPSWR